MTTTSDAQPLDLDAIKARAEEMNIAANAVCRLVGTVRRGGKVAATERFIGAVSESAKDVPALVAEVERLTAQLEAIAVELKEHWPVVYSDFSEYPGEESLRCKCQDSDDDDITGWVETSDGSGGSSDDLDEAYAEHLAAAIARSAS